MLYFAFIRSKKCKLKNLVSDCLPKIAPLEIPKGQKTPPGSGCPSGWKTWLIKEFGQKEFKHLAISILNKIPISKIFLKKDTILN
jgi:hypothetical protein